MEKLKKNHTMLKDFSKKIKMYQQFLKASESI
jgi:hypothetical protein